MLLLCTSDKPAAGTDADVFVTIHGTQGNSPRIKLPSRPSDFARASEDTFRLELPALSEIVKLTVGHNNRGRNPSWHLDHAVLTNEASGEGLSDLHAGTKFGMSIHCTAAFAVVLVPALCQLHVKVYLWAGLLCCKWQTLHSRLMLLK